MTLPQQEIDRIKSTYSINDTRANFVAKEEASIWFKRMGEFAEWIEKNRRWFYDEVELWYKANIPFSEGFTTPELIKLFINSLNEGK